MIPPRYQDTPDEKIPIATAEEGKIWVKVIAGESLGKKAVIDTRTLIMFLDVRLQPGSSFTQAVPEDYQGVAYVWRGSGYLGCERTAAQMGQLGLLGEGDELTLEAAEGEEIRVLLIAGKPLKEPVSKYGPFVMNTWEEIQQAFDDYHSGKLGSIAGAEERHASTIQAKKKQKETGNWNGDI